MNVVTIENSNIKGYHIFKRRPHDSIEMIVKKEDSNPRDPYAMVVNMPEITEIHPSYHDEVTRAAKGKEPEQKVRDAAGRTIGRVPANICKIFIQLLQSLHRQPP